ncbi:pro-sigmaK processing inhibitor BofA family protein [Bacilliculturomica massiliensis]|uniref:pro-sigmaK processing inhibitor BofA family protein n=1 Tax=Bacilliculturomica massiliensis TaxID=1917867 RepID=UPI001FE4B03E|nr:pro-sigmaK processing inhibitor BofA family protein [Bacilliculturomica massiliensis]
MDEGREMRKMDMSTEIGILIAYAFGIIVLYVVGYLFLVPLKLVLRLVLNSLAGGAFILLFNWIGGYLGFHMALSWISAVVVGVLGIPGALAWMVIAGL